MDNKDKKGPQDASRINIHEEYELRYWTERLNITTDRLKAAVEEVGPSVSAVEAYIYRTRTGIQ